MRKTSAFLVCFVSIFTLLAVVLGSSTALAKGESRTYGPFHTTNDLDSSTCGNNWAVDTFNRVFTVNPDHPQFVVEKFNDGGFVTMAGSSPNACNNGPNNGNTVGDGIPGNFHGFEFIDVTSGTYNPHARCTHTACNTTAGFITTVYGPTATSTVTDFKFNYYTKHNGSWQNASPNQGGNNGDITGLCC